jgi:2-methylcitrate dehydratase PrpD
VEQVKHIRAHVHQAAIDVLGPVTDPRTVHQAKFSMGFVLALAALKGHASVTDFSDAALQDQPIREFLSRVEMVLDLEIDRAYPERWIGLVEVETTDGQHITCRVDVPKGDPENSLSRAELEDKAHLLAAYQQGATPEEIERVIARIWGLHEARNVRDLLPFTGSATRE